MKLWMGLILLTLGLAVALAGYAPLGSTFASSLGLIAAGGCMIALGMFVTIFVSARRFEDNDDHSWRIRP